MDSCPYHFGYLSTYRATYSGFPLFKRMGLMIVFTLKIFLKRLVALIPFATRIWPSLTFSSTRAYRETLYSRYMGTVVQLFVWSTNDRICSPSYITDFVQRRKAMIGDWVLESGSSSSSTLTSSSSSSSSSSPIIDTLTVNDAPHVHILRLHPQLYSQKIDAFIARLPAHPHGETHHHGASTVPTAKM